MHHSDKIRDLDQRKQELCRADGITLITIPYWWDKTVESLASKVHKERPDIPIPFTLVTSDGVSNTPPPKTVPRKKRMKSS